MQTWPFAQSAVLSHVGATASSTSMPCHSLAGRPLRRASGTIGLGPVAAEYPEVPSSGESLVASARFPIDLDSTRGRISRRGFSGSKLDGLRCRRKYTMDPESNPTREKSNTGVANRRAADFTGHQRGREFFHFRPRKEECRGNRTRTGHRNRACPLAPVS